MRFIKIITLSIDVINPIKVYSTKDGLFNILVERYEAKCFGGCYIEKINRIVRRTECRINQNCDGGIGTVAAICEVTAIAFMKGEVITRCEIQKRLKDETIIGGPAIAKITLIAHSALSSIDVGRVVPVRVASVKYNPFSDIVAMVAVPFLPTANFTVYKYGKITDTSPLEEVISRIDEEVELRSKLDPGAIETFENLLYAYKTPQTPSGDLVQLLAASSTVAERISAIREGSYIGRDPRMHLTSPQVSAFDRADMVPTGIKVREDIDPIDIMLYMLNDYCNNLRICREMIEIYSTDQMLKDHAALWLVLKKNKV